MMHKAVVKVCGIREPENAREIARCLPDYMGFIFVPESPRYIPPNAWQALLQSVPATTRTVGVFRNALLEELEITVRQLGLTAVQLHGEEDEAEVGPAVNGQ